MSDMNLRIATKIASMARRKNLPPRTLFILIQRCIRVSLRHRDQIRDERRIFRREAGKLKQYLPFAQAQMDVLVKKSKTHRAEEMLRIKQGLVGFGYHLIKDTDRVFDTIGFDGICDLLNINPVHREEARLQEELSLVGLIYIARLENSVSPKSEVWGAGGPLFEACFATIMDWIKTAPEKDLPDLFGADSPFAGVKPVEVKSRTLQ